MKLSVTPSPPPAPGVVKPLIQTWWRDFDSFVLTFTELTEGNYLAYGFYLRSRVTSLSWGFSCFTGREEMAGGTQE